MKQLSTCFQIAGACGLFFLLGIAVIPYAGVQHDEALFSVPLYLFNPKELAISIFHHQVPLMAMSYVGTLKTLLYLPIFAFFRPTVWTVRLPMVLAGAATIFFFYKLCLRSAGRQTALVGALLLATDPVFLLTDTFDWGPVAIEHLLLVTGCFCVARFAQSHLMRDLGFGFFLLGLGLWNKATFIWALAGLVCGAVAVFWPEVRQALRPKCAILAVAAFLFGALPFIMYNVRKPNATFRAGGHLETVNGAFKKIGAVRRTLDGSGLFGFISAPETEDEAKPASTRRGRSALWISRRLGVHYRTGLTYAFLLGLLAVPWWWRSRTARFSLVFMSIAWLAMVMTMDAGGSLHHTVLLWPFPQLFVAVTLAQLPWRRFAMVTGGVLVILNLLVVNQYILDLERNGAWNSFTDAIFPLSEMLGVPHPIYVVDWGMLNTLALFHQGHLVLRAADGPFATDTPSPNDQRDIPIIFSIPDALYIGHVPGREVTAGGRDRLERDAVALGYRKEMLRTVADSNGRAVFEVFRIVPASRENQ